jgi:hypothetical protein
VGCWSSIHHYLHKSTKRLPAVVATGDGAAVVVTYYDFRNDTGASSGFEAADYFAVICNTANDCSKAASWGDEQRLTATSFNILDAPIARGHFLGDYMGLAASGPTTVYTVFGAPLNRERPGPNAIESLGEKRIITVNEYEHFPVSAWAHRPVFASASAPAASRACTTSARLTPGRRPTGARAARPRRSASNASGSGRPSSGCLRRRLVHKSP